MLGEGGCVENNSWRLYNTPTEHLLTSYSEVSSIHAVYTGTNLPV